jgi:hypothetical protein
MTTRISDARLPTLTMENATGAEVRALIAEVRASRSAPSPEPESAGARATAAEEVVNAAWELVSARNLDGSLQAKPTEVSRLKAALIRYRDAPAPRAAGGTTATDPEADPDFKPRCSHCGKDPT